MSLNRRAFLFSSMVIAASPAIARDVAAHKLTADERLVIDYYSTRGLNKFLLSNKSRGDITAIENGRIVARFSALSGKTPGDYLSQGRNVTPAGLFEITFSPDQSHVEAYMQFNQRADQSVDVVHPVIDVPGQSRNQRLRRGTAEEKRISGGCINVAPSDYRLLSQFAQAANQRVYSMDGSKYLENSFLIVMPENAADTRRILGIPEHYQMSIN